MADLSAFQHHDRDLLERYVDKDKVRRRRHEWWPDRVKLVHDQFPSTAGDAEWWHGALGDTDLMAAILRDILRFDMNDPGKEGRRFEVSREDGEVRLHQLMGRDFAHEPFHVVFNVMVAKHSLTQVARKTGISRSRVHRLLGGQEHPDRADLQAIAKGYGKHPSFFREYRTDQIVRAVIAGLEETPEYSADVYRRMAFR